LDDAGDVSRAVRAALARANSVQERQARGGGSVTAQDLEIRRITLDAFGNTGLDGAGDRSARPSWCGPGAAGVA
jgi:hypothetical protein